MLAERNSDLQYISPFYTSFSDTECILFIIIIISVLQWGVEFYIEGDF